MDLYDYDSTKSFVTFIITWFLVTIAFLIPIGYIENSDNLSDTCHELCLKNNFTCSHLQTKGFLAESGTCYCGYDLNETCLLNRSMIFEISNFDNKPVGGG